MATTSEKSLDYDHILTVLRERRDKIEEAILAIEHLKTSETASGQTSLPRIVPETDLPPATEPAKKKHRISPAGRKRMIEANQKRWAAVRAAKEAAGQSAAKPKARKKAGATKKARGAKKAKAAKQPRVAKAQE